MFPLAYSSVIILTEHFKNFEPQNLSIECHMWLRNVDCGLDL